MLSILFNALLAEGDELWAVQGAINDISTNTLLAEGDTARYWLAWYGGISTNTLLAEGDTLMPPPASRYGLFQPTPSSRRVTGGLGIVSYKFKYFNQHPPHGG